MKKTICRLLLGVFIILFVLNACKKDKDEVDYPNYLLYNGKKYELAAGMMINYGSWWENSPASFNIDLILYSSGFNFDIGKGKGNLMYFQMYSSSSSELTDGIYDYEDQYTLEPFTFDYSLFALNFNLETETSSVELEITGGTLNVLKSGSNYEITIDCNAENGKKITGFYSGSLIYEDVTGGKSSGKKRVIDLIQFN